MSSPYSPGHPWFYVQGGIPLYPNEILSAVMASGYQGYLEDKFDNANTKTEPLRSELLRKYRGEIRAELAKDLSGYRSIVRRLQTHRKDHGSHIDEKCSDIHVAASLKHNHIYNDLAHLLRLDELLAHQRDLFDDPNALSR